MMSKLGIYVHIPFCESKCAYCDFASFVCEEKEKYFDALIREIENSDYSGREVDTIYFGGGTPSSVDEKYIETVLNCIKKNFKACENAEITIEANPNSASREKLQAYYDMGINRISFGVQALDDKALKEIGRLHTREEALLAIENAQKVGFKNLSADVMLGLPFMDYEKTLEGVRTLIQAGVTHISSYMLQLEEGTPLFYRVKNNPALLPEADEVVDIYEKIALFLEKNGFLRYEISNFARDGYESRHNLKYWSGEEYIGFGLAASSFIKGKKVDKRITNAKNFEDYYAGKRAVEELSANDKIEEKIMLGLRCRLGFSKCELLKLGYNITLNPNFKKFLEKNIIFQEGDTIKLKPKYYNVSNYIIVNLLP